MKNRWLLALLALGMTLALACGTAPADGDGLIPEIRFSDVYGTNEIDMAIVPEEARNVIQPSGWMNDVYLDNRDELAALGGEPEWSVEWVSGPDMEAYMETNDEWDHAVLQFGCQPEIDCDITYRVNCTWGGQTGSADIVFHARTLAQNNLPTGTTLQKLYVTGVGETLTVTGNLIPSGWQVPGRTDHNFFGLWEYDFTRQDPEDYIIEEINDTTVTFTSDIPGVYLFNGFISRGNVCGGDGVFILVTDDDAPVHLSIRPSELQTCEPCTVAIAAPGADGIRVFGCPWDELDRYLEQYQNEGLDGWSPYWEGEGDTYINEDSDSWGGTYAYAVSACFDGEWTDPAECVASATFTAPNGELFGELINLSSLEIQPDESIEINISQIDNAESTYTALEGENLPACPELDGGITTATINGGDLTPGGIYTVSTTATARGYRSLTERQWFMVNYENVGYAESTMIDDHNSTLTLRIPDLEFDTFTDHPFTLFAPGANRVEYTLYRVNSDGSLEETDSREKDQPGLYVPDALNIRYPGSYVLKARACYVGEAGEENWTDPDDCQAAVTVNAPGGVLPSPSATMPDKAYTGGQVTLHFDETPNAVSYSWWVHADDSMDWLSGGECEQAGDLVINTNELPGSGVYWVELDVNAPGYQEGHGCLHLALLDPNDVELSGDGYYFTVSATEFQTQEPIHLVYYVPGAEAVRIAYRDEWGEERGGPGMDKWESWGWPETIPVYGAACFNGEWNEPAYLCEINVAAPNGGLGEVNGWTSISAAYGNDIEIHYHGNENAEGYSYWFRLEDGGDGLGSGGFDADENTSFPHVLYQPTDALEPGSLYRIMLDVWAPGYVQAHREALFIVEGNPDESIVLSAPDSLRAGECFDVHVDAPGADQVIICTSLDGERWSDGYNEETGWSEDYAADSFGDEGGTVWVWAAAHINGSWNHVTECKAIPVSGALGQADAPAFSLTNTSVLRGDFVKATLGDVSQEAFSFNAVLTNEDGEWCGDYGRGTPGDIYIPTHNLPAGTYSVHGYVRALDYMNGETEQDLTFTVRDPEDYPGGLYAVSTDLQTGERLIWSLYAKYADHVAFCVTDNPDSVNLPGENQWCDGDGDSMYAGDWRYDSFNHSGTYYAYIGAHFHNDDSGEEWWDFVSFRENHAPLEIQVSAPNGALNSPAAEMTDKAYLGDQVTLHFEATPGAASYSWWAHADDSMDWLAGGIREGAGDLVIDTNELPGSGVYWVELDVNGPGYDEGHGCLHLALLDPNDVELSGNGCYFTVSTTDIRTREDVHFLCYFPGAEAVRIAYGDEWGEERGGPGMDKWESWGDPQDIVVSAAGCFDGVWADPVEMCTVHVTATEGWLDEPNFSMPSVVNPGEDVVITFYHVDNAVSYSYWYREELSGEWKGSDGRSDDGEHPLEFPFELVIPAENLEPGKTYRLFLDVNNPGWAEGHAQRLLVVTDPQNEQVTLNVNGSADNTSILINQEYTVSVSAEGADEVGFFDGWTWQWEAGDSFSWTWSDSTEGSRTLFAQARYPDGSVGSSNTIEINYEQLDGCGISASSVQGAAYGGDISVTFGAAANAAMYDLHIVRADDINNDVFYCRYTSPGAFSISTVDAGLVPGEYYAYISTAGYGYGWNSAWYQNGPQESDRFTVDEGQKFFRTDKTEVEVMEGIHVEVYDPEASRIRFDSGYGWWDNDEGNDNGWDAEDGVFSADLSWDFNPENITIRAEGWHDQENEWVEIGRAEITVSAPNGQLGEPVVEISRYQDIQYGIGFMVRMPENCAAYEIEVWDVDENGDRVWLLQNYERYNEDGWYGVEPELLELGRTYTVFVRALGYGYACRECEYAVTMAEPQPVPEITVASDTVSQGEFFRITVNNYDPGSKYHAYFRGGNIEDLQDTEVLYDEEQIYIGTGCLPPDQYQLCVDAFDKTGAADSGTEYAVTINARQDGEAFIVPTEHIRVGRMVPACVYAPGADEVRIVLRQDGAVIDEFHHDGAANPAAVWFWTWAEGNVTVSAEARYGNVWQPVGDTLSLTVAAKGNLEDMNAVTPGILTDDEAFSFHMDPVDGAGWYILCIDDVTAGEQLMNYDFTEYLNDSGDYTVEPGWFFDGKSLQTGHVYDAWISAWQEAWNSSGVNRRFAVVDSDKVITLNLPANLTAVEEEAFAGIGAQEVIINASGPVVIDGNAFADSSVVAVEIPENVTLEGNDAYVIIVRPSEYAIPSEY